MAKKFQHLDYSRGWDDYWSDHPEGYSPQEQMINWSGQLNAMIDFFNKYFDVDLTEYATEVMEGWYVDGRLVDIINEALFNSKADKSTVNALASQLADNARELKQIDERITYKPLLNHTSTKPLITWIDDDGSADFFDYFGGLAAEYGITFTSAISGSRIDQPGKLSTQQIKTLTANGLEVVCHGYSHNPNYKLGDMSDEEIHADFQLAVKALKDVGANYRTIVYPFGQQDNRIKDIARQYFDSGVTTAGGGLGGINYDPFDQYAILRIDVDYPNSLIFPLLDEAMANGKSVVIMSHINQPGWPTDIQNRSLIEYALNLGFKFATIEEWVKHNGNLLQIGETIISKSGNVSGKLGTVEISRVGDYAVNAPITDYPLRKITYFKVTNADTVSYGLPTPIGGGVFTYRDTEDFYSYQMYIGGGNTSDLNMYIRKWADGNWTEWYMPTSYEHARSLTKYTVLSPITDFPKSHTTVFRVNNADALSQGLPGYGFIECFRFTDDVYALQRFQRVGGGGERATLTRGWYDGAWTSWS